MKSARFDRRSIRLRGHNYAAKGGYFLTLCAWQHRCLFGDVVNGQMRTNAPGEIVREEWFRTAKLRPTIITYDYEFVVMPNHIHGIIWIADPRWTMSPSVNPSMRSTQRVAPTHSHAKNSVPEADPSAPTGTDSTVEVVGASPWLARPIANAARAMSKLTGTAVARSNAQPPSHGAGAGSLGAIVAQFKSVTAKRINICRGTPGVPVWQRNYYEHVIRDSKSAERIREYIQINPVRWEFDRENPQATQPDPEDAWLPEPEGRATGSPLRRRNT